MRRAMPLVDSPVSDRGRWFHRVGTNLILPEWEPLMPALPFSKRIPTRSSNMLVDFRMQASDLFGNLLKTNLLRVQ